MLSALSTIVPVPIKHGLYYSVFAVSAEIPVTVWTVFSPRKRRFLFYFLVSLFFTFGVTALMAQSSSAFWPDGDAGRLTFLEDRWNVVLYLLICPGYVAVCVLMLGASISYWSKTLPGPGAPPHLASIRNWRMLISLALCLLATSLLVVNYIYDSVFNSLGVLYWFLNAPGLINRAGFYYVILNYSLMLLTAVAIFAYVGTVISAMAEISSLTLGDEAALRHSVDHINDFWEIMTLARILAALYIINTYIWSYSPLGAHTAANMYVAIFLITLIGIVGTVLPKYLADLKFKSLRADIIALRIDPDEMKAVPSGVNFWGRLADIVVVTGFPLSVLSIDFDIAGFLRDMLQAGM